MNEEIIIELFAIIGICFTSLILVLFVISIKETIVEKIKGRCKNCGHMFHWGDNFCSHCGNPRWKSWKEEK